MSSKPSGNLTVTLGSVLVMLTIVTYVYLLEHELDTFWLLAFVGPIVSFLILGGKVAEKVTEKISDQTEQLNIIQEQTNGKLTARLRVELVEAVLDALEARDKNADDSK